MGLITFLHDWQDLTAGIFTLVAGATAYMGVLKQIKADRDTQNESLKRKETAFLTILSVALGRYSTNLVRLESDLVEIRRVLPKGGDFRERVVRLKRAAEFDIDMLKSWENYISLPIDSIRAIRQFYDSYLEQQTAFEEIHATIKPEIPLLRAVVADSHESNVLAARIGALLAQIDETKAACAELERRLTFLSGERQSGGAYGI